MFRRGYRRVLTLPALRIVEIEAREWRRAPVNTLSPGIVVTPLAKDELAGPRGAGYRRMIEGSAAYWYGDLAEVRGHE